MDEVEQGRVRRREAHRHQIRRGRRPNRGRPALSGQGLGGAMAAVDRRRRPQCPLHAAVGLECRSVTHPRRHRSTSPRTRHHARTVGSHQRAWPRQPRRPVAHLLHQLANGSRVGTASRTRCGWSTQKAMNSLTRSRVAWLRWRTRAVPAAGSAGRAHSSSCRRSTGLQLRSNEQLIGSERQVRKDARPRFEVDEPVCGVRSIDGRPVLATRPWVWLPATRSDPPPSVAGADTALRLCRLDRR